MTCLVRFVAEWMAEQINDGGELYQSHAATEIKRQFGSSFLYTNENGNEAIDRGVLTHFHRLTDQSVVWERGRRLWGKRLRQDEPGARAVR
jgi:hypothetical protein